MAQKQYKPHYAQLKDKWTDKNKKLQKSLWQKHKDALEWVNTHVKHTAVGSLAGFMLLTTPMTGAPTLQDAKQIEKPFAIDVEKKFFLVEDLSHELPDTVTPLSVSQEQAVAQTLSRHFNMRVSASLNHKRLNTTYGYIGQEQHLARYPGDTMYSHFETDQDAENYASTGMAPGLGAWGYFAPSQSQMNKQDVLREKYYIAVQTFLAPGYDENPAGFNAFFRYRKMLVVNPQNGRAVVADIADAGPAQFTGKQLGGSPELMAYLERVDGAQKGPVLYFFIDDNGDKIPLGPIGLQ